MTVCEKELRFFFGIGRRSQDGMMAAWMKAKYYFCARRTFDAQALGADRDAAIGADFDCSANTPNIRPPWAARGWAQDGAFFFLGQIPSMLRDHAQLAMGFMSVAMEAQSLNV